MAEQLAELNSGNTYKIKYGHASNVTDGGSARYPLGIGDDANRRILVLGATEKGSGVTTLCIPYRGILDNTWWVKVVMSTTLADVGNKTLSIDFAYIEF